MYSIHTTLGFIIDSRPSGEAGKLLSIFTRDLGLVMATAQGIRLEKSKLRYSAQLYSFGNFSFVRGREFWRLTNASAAPRSRDVVSPDASVAAGGRDCERQKRRGVIVSATGAGNELIARLALLLCRLLHGEEAHSELFDCVLECVNFSSTDKFTGELIQTLESLTVARVLHKLGYIGDEPQLNGHFQSNDITIELIDKLKEKRTLLNKHINNALHESHL